MDLPEETPKPEEPTPSEDSFPEEPGLPEGFTPIGDISHSARARRRRAHRTLVPLAADERAALLDTLARRAFPSFEFFLFAFLCGVILGAAYLLNAPALLLVGILLAPLLTPFVGMLLAAVTGSWRFFFLTLGVLLVAAVLVFLTGALAGFAGRLWENLPFTYARIHAQLWWPDLLVVALGAGLLAVSFIRSEQKPIAASVMLAYGVFLPISAAGIGLGIGRDISGVTLWPNGLLVSLVHLALAMLVGGIIVAAMHFKPLKISGYILPAFMGILSVAVLVILTGVVGLIRDGIYLRPDGSADLHGCYPALRNPDSFPYLNAFPNQPAKRNLHDDPHAGADPRLCNYRFPRIERCKCPHRAGRGHRADLPG